MGILSRRKGARIELSILHALQDAGIDAEKISRYRMRGPDLRIGMLGRHLKGESKCRAKGFQTLYKWIEKEKVDLLFLRADRSEPLVVMPMSLFIELTRK